ncbi:MAG: hypothetical protein JNL69_02180, partial [Bacteroidia bacterium]|nr:hypothetical protein [Bacteroidia bacterium]
MNFRFTIGKKIGLGFGVIIVLVIISFLLTNVTLNDSRKKTDQVTEIFNPSVATLKELDNLLNRSKLLITKWYYVTTGNDAVDKKALRKLLKDEYPLLKKKIHQYSVTWNQAEQESVEAILALVDQMFLSYQEDIMAKLNSFDSYNDSNIKFEALLPFEDLDTKFNIISENLIALIDKQNSNALSNSDDMLSSFSFLQKIVIWLGIILSIGGIVIAV